MDGTEKESRFMTVNPAAIRFKRRNSGFTIAELLIVVAIIGVLVAIAIPIFTSSLENAKAGTCQANRRSMYAEVVTTAMDGKKTELEVFNSMNPADLGYTCPDNGTWAWNEATRSIDCIAHPSETEDPNITTTKSYLEEWNKFVEEYSSDPAHSTTKYNNDKMRAAFFEKYGGSVPKISFDGKDYDVQPFYQQGSKEAWLFAKVGTGNGWNANFVFDPTDGSWYRCLKADGKTPTNATIMFQDIKDLHSYTTGEKSDQWGNKWEKVDNPQITGIS